MSLTKIERQRLAKLLGMLGSAHAGERDAAALAAHRLVLQRGLTWLAVVNPAPAEHKPPGYGVWRQTVSELLQRPGMLRPWERTFLADLPNFRRLSTKQRYILAEIADRVLKCS